MLSVVVMCANYYYPDSLCSSEWEMEGDRKVKTKLLALSPVGWQQLASRRLLPLLALATLLT